MRQFIDRIAESIARWRRFVVHDIWAIGQPGDDVQDSFVAKQVRVAVLLVQKFIEDALTVRAAALAFATSLAIVPVLFLLFMIIQSLNLGGNLYTYLEDELDQTIERAWGQVMPGDDSPDEDSSETEKPSANHTDDVQSKIETWMETTTALRETLDAIETTPAPGGFDEVGQVDLKLKKSIESAENIGTDLQAMLETTAKGEGEFDSTVFKPHTDDIALAVTAAQALAPIIPTSGDTATEFSTQVAALSDAQRALADSVQRVSARFDGQAANKRAFTELLGLVFQGMENSAEGDTVNIVQLLVDQVESSANNVGALTLAGGIFLLTTVFGLMRNVEAAFASIWGSTRKRSYWRFFSEYLTVILVLPVVAIGVLGLTAALSSSTVLDHLGPLAVAVQGARFLMVWLAFAAVFAIVPGAKVRFRYAIVGGIVSGTAWVLTSMAYVEFQISMANYSLFWSTWAQFPLLLMWIYVSWIIVLFGAELTYAYQHEKTFAMERWATQASYGYREAVGLRAMLEMAWRFDQGLPSLVPQKCAEEWNVPLRLLNETLAAMSKAGLINECTGDPPTYQPARALNRITVNEVLFTLRDYGKEPSKFREEPAFRELLDTLHDGGANLRNTALDKAVREHGHALLAQDVPATEGDSVAESA